MGCSKYAALTCVVSTQQMPPQSHWQQKLTMPNSIATWPGQAKGRSPRCARRGARTDRASGILADYADRLKVAGLACERAYDSLTPAR